MAEKWLWIGIPAIAVVGIVALVTGHNGTVLTTVVGGITGLVGYLIGKSSVKGE